ncbi:hypothetical protein MC885_008186 [Smutsia gigantea]|nr:hypothetical protein MC885_008186 [Smutsia gigantea]
MALRELKVCLLGDTGVGKSSIVWRFVEDSFDPNINPTIGTPALPLCSQQTCSSTTCSTKTGAFHKPATQIVEPWEEKLLLFSCHSNPQPTVISNPPPPFH